MQSVSSAAAPSQSTATAFDPVAIARRKMEAEERQRQIQAAYEQLRPVSTLDAALDVINKVRGLLGSFLGPLVGSMLDLFYAYREFQQKHADLRIPQGGVPSPSGGGAAPSIPSVSVPSTPPRPTQAAPAGPSIPTMPSYALAPEGESNATYALGPSMASTGSIGRAAPWSGGGAATASMVGRAAPWAEPGAVAAAGAAVQAGSALEGLAAAAGPAGLILAAVGAAVYQVIGAFNALKGILDGFVNKYAQYSQPLAQAEALSEVRATLGDMRRAQTVGPQLAQYVQITSDIQQRYENIKVTILQRLLPIANALFALVEKLMALIESGVEIQAGIVRPISEIAQMVTAILRLGQNQDVLNDMDPTRAVMGPQGPNVGVRIPQGPGIAF